MSVEKIRKGKSYNRHESLTVQAEYDIKSRPYWKELKHQFSDEELELFLYHWKQIIAQFRKDVLATEELQIVDDLRNAHSYGYIVFNDPQDVIESFEGIESKSKVKPYNFRGDGRDYLEVEITPQINQL